MFPRSWISFGVLHGIALMLIVVAPHRVVGDAGAWPLGAVAIAAAALVQHPFFDTRATNWVGLVTRLPVTEDYVPVLPWLGVDVVGRGGRPTGCCARRRRCSPGRCRGRCAAAVARPLEPQLLHAHQPVLIGGVAAAGLAARPAEVAWAATIDR